MLAAPLMALIWLVHLTFWFYTLVLVARVIISWMPPYNYHPLVRTFGPPVYALTEPLLAPIRRIISPHTRSWPIDISPFVLYLALMLLERIILRFLTIGL